MRENQHPKASGKELKSTLYKKGRNSPDVSLDEIADNLIAYFKGFSLFQHYEKDIEKKYDIKKEHDGCWPVDDIKRAWGKTQRMYETSSRRKHWSLAVMLQMMKNYSRYDDEGETQNKRREAPDPPEQNHISNDETIYIHVPFSEMFGHKSSFSSDPNAPMERVPYKLKDKVPSLTEIKKNTSYVMQYDNRTRNAAWVYEILNKSIVEENDLKQKSIKRSSFKVDGSIHELFQTPEGKKPYPNTCYERGHLAPACNHRCSQKAQNNTFSLCNIAPQCWVLNHGIWRSLENHCSEIAEETGVRNVHVYTGPLYTSDDNKPQRVNKKTRDRNNHVCTSDNDNSKCVKYKFVGGKAVPTHFFKVIIEEMEDGSVKEPKCYKMRNDKLIKDKAKLPEFEVDIKVIERESGLIFTDRRCEEEMIDRTLIVNRKINPDPMTVNEKIPNKELRGKREMTKSPKCVKKVSKAKLPKDELAKFKRESGLITKRGRTLTVNRKINPEAQNCSPEIRVRISTTLSDPAGV